MCAKNIFCNKGYINSHKPVVKIYLTLLFHSVDHYTRLKCCLSSLFFPGDRSSLKRLFVPKKTHVPTNSQWEITEHNKRSSLQYAAADIGGRKRKDKEAGGMAMTCSVHK
ncbi:hypothetical protein XENORESO_000171 [Xenotaenia resolanae]|uniref:Uncharacterized protein n=1 Tax=Xenotaenia resolanae TaxID=208358 RepID=A0ABV0X1M5_9TELE